MTEIDKFAVLLGERIKAIRKEMKLKRAGFSQLVQMSEDTIGLIERGQKLPRLETLYKISSSLNIPLVKILDFEKKIKPSIKHQDLHLLNLYVKTELPRQIQKIRTVAQNILNKANSYSTAKTKKS